MADGKSFKDQISPFVWVEDKESASVVLGANRYLQDVFDAQDFQGSGYDWEGLARVFLDEKRSDLSEKIHFDSEAGMFCVFAEDTEALQDFIRAFKDACEDRPFIQDLLSRAEPD